MNVIDAMKSEKPFRLKGSDQWISAYNFINYIYPPWNTDIHGLISDQWEVLFCEAHQTVVQEPNKLVLCASCNLGNPPIPVMGVDQTEQAIYDASIPTGKRYEQITIPVSQDNTLSLDNGSVISITPWTTPGFEPAESMWSFQATEEIKSRCECGSEKAGCGTHSNWCPKGGVG